MHEWSGERSGYEDSRARFDWCLQYKFEGVVAEIQKYTPRAYVGWAVGYVTVQRGFTSRECEV